ncbi:MAG: helix-turn-helix domain-containing protein [Alicyclobacillus sp.]|nr:helix-turn-helix domain-containing protein [Alicyclobacillus sp.]
MLDKKAIGTAIRAGRKSRHLTQAQLAKATSLSRSYIADIETGRYTPSIDAFSKIAGYLDLDMNLLKSL